MLLAISLRDFVLVDKLEIDFEPGMTVLTGETGAGKSLLVDALSLAMGERAEAGVVRDGAVRAEISAEFHLAQLPALRDWLIAGDLDDEYSCVLRRVIDSSGRSRCFINGRSATVQQLREAGEFLVDLHGQHAHQSLIKPAFQRSVLDAYAGAETLANLVSTHYRNYRAFTTQLSDLQHHQTAAQSERERLLWQVEELAALQFDAEEWETMQAQHVRLAHTMQLEEGVALALENLSEGETNTLSMLQTLRSNLAALHAFDAHLADTLSLIDSASAELDEASHNLRQYADKLDTDPGQLADLEQNIAQVMAMARKYRVRPEALGTCLSEAQARLAELGSMSDLAELERQANAEHAAWQHHAQQLSKIRTTAAAQLSDEVSQIMQHLALAGGQFAIALNPLDEGDAHGLEHIEFLVAPHEGAGLKPLAKVASGGELSRISLALQTAISQVAAVPVLIFDEVDVGIGGSVAEAVGQLLRKLADTRQVLCITHLPQVAAQGTHHLQVSKLKQDQGGVISRISHLTDEARVDEIARMLGGAVITDTTRIHATEMLKQAANN
jgi:DNA repair protein RecN (Recombination protein N)